MTALLVRRGSRSAFFAQIERRLEHHLNEATRQHTKTTMTSWGRSVRAPVRRRVGLRSGVAFYAAVVRRLGSYFSGWWLARPRCNGMLFFVDAPCGQQFLPLYPAWRRAHNGPLALPTPACF